MGQVVTEMTEIWLHPNNIKWEKGLKLKHGMWPSGFYSFLKWTSNRTGLLTQYNFPDFATQHTGIVLLVEQLGARKKSLYSLSNMALDGGECSMIRHCELKLTTCFINKPFMIAHINSQNTPSDKRGLRDASLNFRCYFLCASVWWWP
jgi:hypothetical protein